MQDSWNELLWWRKHEMIVKDDTFLEIPKIIFWHFHCLKKNTFVHIYSLLSPY